MYAPQTLNLTPAQQMLLTNVGATQLYYVDNERFGGDVPLPAYTNGIVVVFVSGNRADHERFVTQFFGPSFATNLVEQALGIFIYGGPAYEFAQKVNLVTINTVTAPT